MRPNQYNPGDHTILREVWRGEVWAIRPCIVVRDEPEVVALYIPSQTPWKRPRTLDDRVLRVPDQPWMLGDATWQNHALHICPQGEAYSVLLIWSEEWQLYCWYINIEEPVRPSPVGFDYMDWALDVVVTPDMSEWRMKDEDELQEFVDKGLFSPPQAEHVRTAAQQALDRLLARRAPFDERWEDWRPDPAWGIPALPERWE